jgi:uncharacterized protein YdcH (DUF465 family)
MKNRILSLAALALIVLASCTQMNEQKYNDTVVNMYTTYSNSIGAKMSAIGNSSDKQKSLADVKSIEKTTDSCINVMNGLKPSEEAKDFHQKVLAVFQTVKADFVPLADKITNIDASQDVDAYNKLVDEYNNLNTKIDQAETAAQTAQQVYVSKVGMKIK